MSQIGNEVQGFPVKGVVAITITTKLRFHNHDSLGLSCQIEDVVYQSNVENILEFFGEVFP